MLRLGRARSSLASLKGSCQRLSSLLQGEKDSYHGVTVTEDISSFSPDEFQDRLAYSLTRWKADATKGVWLRVPISASNLIPIAVKQNFWFHHAGPDYLLLCTWLQGGQNQSKLPPRPSHYVGVSGFVLNSKRELLVIQEKNGPAANMDLWKLPGGLCDQNENLAAGSIREVKEETGIECEYQCLASIVEFHGGHGAAKEQSSDLYCISVLRPLPLRQTIPPKNTHQHEKQEHQDVQDQIIVPQAGEIAACEWRPVDDVLAHPFYAPSTAFGVAFRSALAVATTMHNGGRYGAITSEDQDNDDRVRSRSTVCRSNVSSSNGSFRSNESGSDRGSIGAVLLDRTCAGLSASSFPLGRGRRTASVLYSKYTPPPGTSTT